MTTSRGFETNEYHNGMTFHNLDDGEQPIQRYSPIRLRSDDQISTNYDHKYRSTEPYGIIIIIPLNLFLF